MTETELLRSSVRTGPLTLCISILWWRRHKYQLFGTFDPQRQQRRKPDLFAEALCNKSKLKVLGWLHFLFFTRSPFAQLSWSLLQSDTGDNYAKTCVQKCCIEPPSQHPTSIPVQHQRQQSRPCRTNACIKSCFMYIARLLCLLVSTCGGGDKRKKKRSENGRLSPGRTGPYIPMSSPDLRIGGLC